MKKLLSFKRNEQTSGISKVVLVVWLVFVGVNREKLFRRVELVPIENEQMVDEDSIEQSGDLVEDSAKVTPV